jgi:hypothetical protein
MPRFEKINNERSETIELIKIMDTIVKRNTWQIKSIGGESTLNTGKQQMFPDIILYGDNTRTQILQGWEVKMPDTPITNSEFIANARHKAEILDVNSFVIWNFSYGVLYIKNNDDWIKTITWDKTCHIRDRTDVVTYRSDWELLILNILSDLNYYFSSGKLHHAKINDIITDSIFIEIIKRNKGITAEYLHSVCITNTVTKAYISQWWRGFEREYRFDEGNKYNAFAKYILINWINKFTFANLIKSYHNPALSVETINDSISPTNALSIFEDISNKCDFYNVFEIVAYSDVLPIAAWDDLTSYNAFLTENGIINISQIALQNVLENSVNQFKRNVTGLYSTPQKIAKILVKAGIDNLTVPVIDPCCGTGTIIKEIIAVKESALGVESAYSTTYASDKFSFPMQIANIAMMQPNAINLPCLLFHSNAFDLLENKIIEIIDPKNGSKRKYMLPKFGGVVSNLPFVAFDNKGHEDKNNILTTLKYIQKEWDIKLSGRMDLYQAILFHLHGILADNANVSVVTSNSWLGTIAGQNFYIALKHYYDVESVITSGNGKWFDNADIITLMLFLKKKTATNKASKTRKTFFGMIHKTISDLTDDDTSQIIDSIKLKKTIIPNVLSFKSYTQENINEILKMKISMNSLFYEVDWLPEIKDILCPVTQLFDVFRGIKTGQYEIYYLRDANTVDKEYIGSILRNVKNCKKLTANADTNIFICDKSINELILLKHKKTLIWINRYKGHINKSVPNKNNFWQNLSNEGFSGSTKIRLFTGMNPEQRIFFGLLNKPTIINQRIIGFNPLDKLINIELCHALLNTIIGVFYIEASGFPKGLGALDSNKDNIKNIMMLDPKILSPSESTTIIKKFKPLLKRNIMTTQQEYTQNDRLDFEESVASFYGYSEQFDRIKNCVLEMQKVRLSVKRKSNLN